MCTIGDDALCAMMVKTADAIAQQTYALQKIVRQQRFKNIQFKISRGAAKIDRHIITKNLTEQHGDCLALRRIDIDWKDGTDRLDCRNRKFPKAGDRKSIGGGRRG